MSRASCWEMIQSDRFSLNRLGNPAAGVPVGSGSSGTAAGELRASAGATLGLPLVPDPNGTTRRPAAAGRQPRAADIS